MACKTKKYSEGTERVKGPGTRISDSIPAMLSKDEAVLNAGAADMMGRKNIAMMNKMHAPMGAKTSIKHGILKAAAGVDTIDERLMQMAHDRATTTRLADMAKQKQFQAAQPFGVGKARPSGATRPVAAPAVERVSANVLARKSAPSIASRGLGAAGRLLNNPLTIGATLMANSSDAGAAGDDAMFEAYRALPKDAKGNPVMPDKVPPAIANNPTSNLRVVDANASATPISQAYSNHTGAGVKQPMSIGDAKYLQRQTPSAEPQYAQQVETPATKPESIANMNAEWLAARGVKPGMKNIAEGGNEIYKTGKNSFVGVGPGGPSEEARQASYAKELANNRRYALERLARGGDMKAAEEVRAIDSEAAQAPISALALQRGQMENEDFASRRGIMQKYLETLTPEQQAQFVAGGKQQSKGYGAIARKLYNADGVVTGEDPFVYSQDTGEPAKFQQEQADKQQQQAPQKVKYGDVVDGYKYIGGDPSKQTSWVKS